MQGDLFIEEFDGDNNTPVDVSDVDIYFGNSNKQREMMNRAVENLRSAPKGKYMIFPTGCIHKLPQYGNRNDFPYMLNTWAGRVVHPRYSSMRYPLIEVGRHTLLWHRLLAMLLVHNPLPADKPIVHHINNDPLDYSLSNLEWVSHSENNIHAAKMKVSTTKYYGSIHV
tara:strand:- start:121 stop:627 length:507 start_codon:yes stop_codon:yes gene_type:complete